jgi:hypothetical protein
VAVHDEYQGYPPLPYRGCALHGELGRLAAIKQPRPGGARPSSPSLPSPAAIVLDAIPAPSSAFLLQLRRNALQLTPPLVIPGVQLAVPKNTTSMSLWVPPASIG